MLATCMDPSSILQSRLYTDCVVAMSITSSMILRLWFSNYCCLVNVIFIPSSSLPNLALAGGISRPAGFCRPRPNAPLNYAATIPISFNCAHCYTLLFTFPILTAVHLPSHLPQSCSLCITSQLKAQLSLISSPIRDVL